MKTTFIAMLCIVLLLCAAPNAKAQIVAGSPEAKAMDKVDAETNPETKATLLLDFAKEYPQSKAMTDVYVQLLEIYRQKNDTAKVVEYGEKAIQLDPENITALLAVSRNYSIEKKNLDKAVSYAQKAVDTVAKRKAQPAPPTMSEEQWKQWLESNDQAAKSMLAYAHSVRP
jgi:tetratricopeptide (TPR) repeat protein